MSTAFPVNIKDRADTNTLTADEKRTIYGGDLLEDSRIRTAFDCAPAINTYCFRHPLAFKHPSGGGSKMNQGRIPATTIAVASFDPSPTLSVSYNDFDAYIAMAVRDWRAARE